MKQEDVSFKIARGADQNLLYLLFFGLDADQMKEMTEKIQDDYLDRCFDVTKVSMDETAGKYSDASIVLVLQGKPTESLWACQQDIESCLYANYNCEPLYYRDS